MRLRSISNVDEDRAVQVLLGLFAIISIGLGLIYYWLLSAPLQMSQESSPASSRVMAPKAAAGHAAGPLGLSLPLALDGGRVVAPGGEAVPVSRQLRGWVDSAEISDHRLEVTGWAADVDARLPAVSVVVFINGRFRGAGVPAIMRPDVRDALGFAAAGVSGFSVAIPLDGVPAAGTDVRVFGVDGNGAVAELRYNASYKFRR